MVPQYPLRKLSCWLAIALLGFAARAHAQTAEDDGDADDSEDADEPNPLSTERLRDPYSRPYGMADFGVGVLALPDAEVCVSGNAADCRSGDMSLELSAWPLFRASRHWAFGAGVTLALTPTTTPPQNDSATFPRDHSRNYYMAELTARYYPVASPSFEAWGGLTSGLIVVSDNFQVKGGDATSQPFVGPTGVNVATEGFTMALAGGLNWGWTERLRLGGMLRVGNWFLPDERARTPLGDEASLSGRVTMVDLNVTLTYAGR
jgi:hypothetical protein